MSAEQPLPTCILKRAAALPPLEHPTGLIFFLTNHLSFPFLWVDHYARAAASGACSMHCVAGTYPKTGQTNTGKQTFDKMPVVQIRLQRELFLQQLPWAAAFVSQQLHVKWCSPKGFQLLLQSQNLQKSWKRGWEGEGEKCNSNIPCWYSFAALQSNFNGRRLQTDSSLTRQGRDWKAESWQDHSFSQH